MDRFVSTILAIFPRKEYAIWHKKIFGGLIQKKWFKNGPAIHRKPSPHLIGSATDHPGPPPGSASFLPRWLILGGLGVTNETGLPLAPQPRSSASIAVHTPQSVLQIHRQSHIPVQKWHRHLRPNSYLMHLTARRHTSAICSAPAPSRG